MISGYRFLAYAGLGLLAIGVLAWFLFGGGHPACQPNADLSWLKC